jgi:hypothetical protein
MRGKRQSFGAPLLVPRTARRAALSIASALRRGSYAAVPAKARKPNTDRSGAVGRQVRRKSWAVAFKGRRYWVTSIQSTGRFCPTTNDAASEHSHTTASATSSGRLIRPIGWRAVIIVSKSGMAAMNGSSIGVRIVPGLTALIRMRCGAYSSAAALVRPTTPCLLAT